MRRQIGKDNFGPNAFAVDLLPDRRDLAPLRTPVDEVVNERVNAGLGNVGVRSKICAAVEGTRRCASLLSAKEQEMIERIRPVGSDVRILFQIPVPVEKTGSLNQPALTPKLTTAAAQRADHPVHLRRRFPDGAILQGRKTHG